jgi:hypothetical protein
MKRRLLIVLLLGFLCLLWLVQGAGAMSSNNYKLDWFTPLVSGGGGPVASENYAANFTVGQSVIGASANTSYKVGLGYWYGVAGSYQVYLPLILK